MNCQDHLYRGAGDPRSISRRWFLGQCGVGLGSMALAHLLGQDGYAAATPGTPSLGANPLAPRAPHFAPKAKRVIFLFMAGGPSHLELFDNKPHLAKFDGKLPPADLLKGYRAAFINPDARLLGPKFPFARHGQSGTELSTLLPHLAGVVDDIAVIKGMTTDAFNHAPGQIMMSTGSMIFGRPSFGAWTCYGLGSESNDLPGFVVFSTGKKGPSGGNSNWGSGFLPTVYQGVQFRNGGEPVLYLTNPKGIDEELQRDSLDVVRQLNESRLKQIGDPEIATRIHSYETAFRMQMTAPEVVDIGREPQHILDMYGAKPGKPSFAGTCLLARRLLERGVRFVEIFHEAWDQHGALVSDLKHNCEDTDQACAALVKDLKQRGMLEDTLVVWGGEFGRTPMVQGGADGRDHHPNAFTMWVAGGGIKPGITYGESDDLGFSVARDKVHVHDLHATLLHLLGFDHTRLTYRFQGRDFRLTDVHGNVVRPLLA
ncbi:hypothetical protein OJF2_55930 [Aquisphaera giovannonii]|uniref:Sulfatase n=1 Tax=Aquisphaera giovannonii TaxID=406548 RepID=A0A5B9W8Q8_9BACT|nr:DUF1501 domain-containing protein [Aquisphaera giovannonii]QEH37008.1 hypothetical protein OJF2_55930 [Aquisphaera giovannonii]